MRNNMSIHLHLIIITYQTVICQNTDIYLYLRDVDFRAFANYIQWNRTRDFNVICNK